MKKLLPALTLTLFAYLSPALAQQQAEIKQKREVCERLYVGKAVTVRGFDNSPKGVIIGIGPEKSNGDRSVSYRLTESGCIRGSGCMRPGEVNEMWSCSDFL